MIERAKRCLTIMRTSISHPIRIAEVDTRGGGRVGLSFCPGKVQPHAMTGAWARDLGLDLDAIRAWGAAAVVTLVEAHELRALGVAGMGDAVRMRGMRWHHLPIPDVTAPGTAFEAAWRGAGGELRGVLREGGRVFVHCKGGLGRAGTVAARLLVELGDQPERAIAAVRQARPGAIQTLAQERHVLGCGRIREEPQ